MKQHYVTFTLEYSTCTRGFRAGVSKKWEEEVFLSLCTSRMKLKYTESAVLVHQNQWGATESSWSRRSVSSLHECNVLSSQSRYFILHIYTLFLTFTLYFQLFFSMFTLFSQNSTSTLDFFLTFQLHLYQLFDFFMKLFDIWLYFPLFLEMLLELFF